MKIILTVENHPGLNSEFEYSYHWRFNKIVFIQGDTEDAFITFEDEKAEEIHQMILDAYELGGETFTINFPREHASAFTNLRKKKEVWANILEKMND